MHKNMKTAIENNLRRALLLDGKMEYMLYEYELEEHMVVSQFEFFI